ncbi:hypothetical protein AZA_87614 [Nitrospirillum viridazoti Y2]|uniref:DUF2199 domain-containing protein n=1 Tax=Nitrospirillum amazonense TaxID=28077 RepID=A0A560HUE8_9PROT|nr:DUF2199 domain-containing protein [Nitrospirillum amazonense]EGY02783.1 hypothetical protein AZA_87614 [Nitrospirillum amazonense Y2]TWB49985.1 hypothetical protein FBZ92_12491 [Nitrospirillum amazonense]
MFRFKCTTCDEWHEGMPTFSAAAPLYYYSVPAAERPARCVLTSDTCVVDQTHLFVRGNIEIHVHGTAEPFVWGVWVSLSRPNFDEFSAHLDNERRAHLGPYFGWLSAALSPYPNTENLKTRLHLRDNGMRPYIELEPTDHPLAVEQRQGIDMARVAAIYAQIMHRAE